MSDIDRVIIREANHSDHDLEGMVRVANLARPEISVTVEFMHYLDSIIDPKVKQKRWLAELDGKIVGYAMYTQDAAMYHPRKFRATTMVEPEYETHGIGNKLYAALLADIKQHDPLEILLIVREDHERGVAFGKAHGYVEFNRRWVSRLDLATFDPEPFLTKLKAVEESGIVIRSYADLKEDPQYRELLEENFFQLHAALTHDIPMPLAQVDDTPEQFHRDILGNPSFSPELSLVALDGTDFVGLTEVLILEGSLLIWRSGTIKSHRRRGIATAIKIKSIMIAKELGYQSMETSNDLINKPILAVNDALGFVQDPAELWMMLRLSDEHSVDIQIDPFTDEYKALTSILVANNPMSLATADSLRHFDDQMEPEYKLRRWVARHNGQVVGVSRMNYSITAPTFDDLYISVDVHPDHQRQGIGDQLFHHLMQAVNEEAPKHLKTVVMEGNTAAETFAKKHGFSEYARRWDSTLDISATDLTPFLPSLDKVAANAIVIKTMAELQDTPDYMQNLYHLANSAMKDIPFPDPVTPLSFERFQRFYVADPTRLEEGSFVALDGDRFVGITVVLKLGEERLYVGFTAIDREYRRKGIATALKVHSIQYGRQNGYKILGTTNDTANQAILTLNDAIGFVRQPAQILMVRDL